MDDTTTIGKPDLKLTIKGTEYPMVLPDADTLSRLILVLGMDATMELKMEASGALIRACVGDKAWTQILRGVLKGGLSVDDLFEGVHGIAEAMEGTPPADA